MEASGAFSYRTEGRRMVKPQQDYLKQNIVRNLEKKGEKELSPGFGNVHFGDSESSSIPMEHIREYFRYFIYRYIFFFYFYGDNTFYIHSMDAYSENCFHLTLPYDQGIQAISA